MYEDRTAAGRILAERLHEADLRPDVVLAVPAGGVNVARPVRERFDAALGLIVAEPIRTPATDGLPVGAATDTGVSWVDDRALAAFDVDETKLEVEKQRAFREARDKHELYAAVDEDPTPEGTVVVVDEGLLSETEMHACVAALDGVAGCHTVVAAPVGLPSVVARLHAVADDVVVDETPPAFEALGGFYENLDRAVVP